MKKKSLFLIACLLTGFTVAAQTAAGSSGAALAGINPSALEKTWVIDSILVSKIVDGMMQLNAVPADTVKTFKRKPKKIIIEPGGKITFEYAEGSETGTFALEGILKVNFPTHGEEYRMELSPQGKILLRNDISYTINGVRRAEERYVIKAK
ncbi:MAG: hypothetical protein LBC98_08080 [Prevotellaceae bacterium]|jgi:hypothetical protein|nr:hypothetical protein [Prevotellaceae bacterium]